MNTKFLITIVFLLFSLASSAQEEAPKSTLKLSVEKIMEDPLWIGGLPKNPYWKVDSECVYFRWNPEKAQSDSLYKYELNTQKIEKVSKDEKKMKSSVNGEWNKDKTQKVFEKNGDIYLYEKDNGAHVLQQTNARESNPKFSFDDKKIIFEKDNNLYSIHLEDGLFTQLTDFRKGGEPNGVANENEQEEWLTQEELNLMNVLKTKKEKLESSKKTKEKEEKPKRPKSIYIGEKNMEDVELSPDGQYVVFNLSDRDSDAQRTIVPSYVTESGFTKDLSARTNVGRDFFKYETGIYDLLNDTVYYVQTDELPKITEISKYWVSEEEMKDKAENPKETFISSPKWSGDGINAFVIVQSLDNKDRWLALLDVTTGKLKNIDHQHDEAWIGGPGISSWRSFAYLHNVGWMPDNERIWFQSEESGYSHLYTANTKTGKKKQLTKGDYEVFNPQISKDKTQWYFTSSEGDSGQRHFYRMPLKGGKKEKLTSLKGNNNVELSPDEKYLLIRHSYSNKPWELYLQENKADAKPKQITSSLTDEFKSYQWRAPEIVQFKAEDGKDVTARLYQPQNPTKKGPAVIFVHGAGYLQNAHQWWSTYFREYMFHNLLVDLGYTVLDIDYRASAGYGRDWRTGIYRNMGGKDLSDQVDGAKFLVEKYDIDEKRIGIYGGSYGGFITIMALCKYPDTFACGAALRSVTDWAHYNHAYTSNILNVPYIDSTAYRQSSPIYFAEGLKNPLLMCHGMIDTNVHFQDVVRLSQRFIELGKDNWELAVYPLEGHSFVEPTSWTDEYKRILKLFEENLK